MTVPTNQDRREMEAAKTIALALLFIPLGIVCEFWVFLESTWRGIGYSRAEIADALEKLKVGEVERG